MLNAVFHLYFDVLESPSPAAPDARAAFRAGQQGGHDEILACIEARNSQGGGRAMQAHLQHLQRHLPFKTETKRRPERRSNRGGLDG
jgi:DNA-binding FadR family transcriptional regulator